MGPGAWIAARINARYPRPSSLIDYISSYDVINKTRIIPVTRGAVIYVAALAAAPFAFVWVLATPLEKVIEEILKRML